NGPALRPLHLPGRRYFRPDLRSGAGRSAGDLPAARRRSVPAGRPAARGLDARAARRLPEPPRAQEPDRLTQGDQEVSGRWSPSLGTWNGTTTRTSPSARTDPWACVPSPPSPTH